MNFPIDVQILNIKKTVIDKDVDNKIIDQTNDNFIPLTTIT